MYGKFGSKGFGAAFKQGQNKYPNFALLFLESFITPYHEFPKIILQPIFFKEFLK